MRDVTKEVDAMWSDIESSRLKIKILMGGKCGVGKSSVINAVIGAAVSKLGTDGKPCTKANEELIWPTDVGNFSITDVPGFGEAEPPYLAGLSYEENIKALAKAAHLFILVLKCDDRALELEGRFMNEWKSDPSLSMVPVVIVVNQIDKMNPVRDWNPQALNLSKPTTPKELNICSYLGYVSSLAIFSEYHHSNRIVAICAGEYVGDATFGIDKLRDLVSADMPEIFRLMIDRDRFSKEQRSDAIINAYALSAAASAVQPIPIVDSFIIAPLQIAMMIHLGKIYGVHITKAAAGGIVNSIGMSLMGNLIFLNLVSFFPGIKQVVGPAIAYGLTTTSGLIIRELFLTNNLNPSTEQLRDLAERYKAQSKAAKGRFEREKSQAAMGR